MPTNFVSFTTIATFRGTSTIDINVATRGLYWLNRILTVIYNAGFLPFCPIKLPQLIIQTIRVPTFESVDEL